MKNSVKYLCMIILTCYCDAQLQQPIIKFEDDEKIDMPEMAENCTISASYGYVYVFCTDFSMVLSHSTKTFYGDTKNDNEYSTSIYCKHSSYPQQYLRNANSNRNSLDLIECIPESGSFGEGWSRLRYLILSISKKDLPQLKREHFSGLNNLWYLQLQLSTKQVMPDDLFADLSKLRTIRMSVMYANTKLFANLNELESLQLTIGSQESLNNFDTSELKSAPKFKDLELIFNNFTRLTKRFFEGCQNIEHLSLLANTIETIDFDAFEPLTNLKNIEIEHNVLASLPEGLFSKNKKLETVKIGCMNPSLIPPTLLLNLTNLREVIINGQLTSIPNDSDAAEVNTEKRTITN